jgi:uncharacterized SAM-binding protein YcdF (DUF218 family)
VFILTALAGILLALGSRKKLGLGLALASLLLLYVFAMPFVSLRLLHGLEAQVPETSRSPGEAQAIVVLSGTVQHGDGGKVPDELGLLSLERVERAAEIAKNNNLPILVSGGEIGDSTVSMAALMAGTLQRDYGITARWQEDKSHTTFENAEYSARLLAQDKIHTVILVTQPWHMPRALWACEHAGLDVIPMPTMRTYLQHPFDPGLLLPDTQALTDSFYALHEMLGLVYYKLYFGLLRG